MWRLNVAKDAVLKLRYRYHGFIAQQLMQFRA
jgi:hypothetical protein